MEGSMVAGTVQLAGGGGATICRCAAPLPAADGMAVTWFLEGAFGALEKPDVFVTPAAKGLLEDVARTTSRGPRRMGRSYRPPRR